MSDDLYESHMRNDNRCVIPAQAGISAELREDMNGFPSCFRARAGTVRKSGIDEWQKENERYDD
jgi:hypothetical protein